jgi:hypothetical protein
LPLFLGTLFGRAQWLQILLFRRIRHASAQDEARAKEQSLQHHIHFSIHGFPRAIANPVLKSYAGQRQKTAVRMAVVPIKIAVT